MVGRCKREVASSSAQTNPSGQRNQMANPSVNERQSSPRTEFGLGSSPLARTKLSEPVGVEALTSRTIYSRMSSTSAICRQVNSTPIRFWLNSFRARTFPLPPPKIQKVDGLRNKMSGTPNSGFFWSKCFGPTVVTSRKLPYNCSIAI